MNKIYKAVRENGVWKIMGMSATSSNYIFFDIGKGPYMFRGYQVWKNGEKIFYNNHYFAWVNEDYFNDQFPEYNPWLIYKVRVLHEINFGVFND